MHRIDGKRLLYLAQHYRRAMDDPKTYEDMFYFCELMGYVEGVIDSSPRLQSHIRAGANALQILDLVVLYVTRYAADAAKLSESGVDIIHAAIMESTC